LRSVKIAFACTLSLSAWASNHIADAAWIEADGDIRSLHIAHYNGREWIRTKTPAYQTKNAITAPALTTDKHGKKLLIWTEQRRKKFVLMMSTGSDTSGSVTWSDAVLFSDYGTENFSAAMVRDLNGVVWAFWSASTSGLSDIVVSKQNGLTWSRPRRINKQNDVPDNQPSVQLDIDGNIVLDWSTYDLQAKAYQRARMVIDSEFKDTAPSLLDPVQASEVPVPGFIPSNAVSTLHFPSNNLIQSTKIAR